MGDAKVASRMLEVDPQLGRSEVKGALNEVFAFQISRKLQATSFIAAKRMRRFGQHGAERRIIIEHVKDPEAKLEISPRLLIDRGRGANFNHPRNDEAVRRRGEALYGFGGGLITISCLCSPYTYLTCDPGDVQHLLAWHASRLMLKCLRMRASIGGPACMVKSRQA